MAAFFAWRAATRTTVAHRQYLRALALMLAAIGIGSITYHAAPSPLTLIGDFGPIYLFIFLSLGYLLYVLGYSRIRTILASSLLALTLILTTLFLPAAFINGSFRHLIVLTTLLILLIQSIHRFGRTGAKLGLVVTVYTLAIIARSIDPMVCPILPIGTHFIWHLLNALAGYLALSFLAQLSRQSRVFNKPQA